MSFAVPAYSAEPHKQIQAQSEHYKADALKLLERLVNIDSGSGYEPGLTQVRDIAVDELKQLGFSIQLVPDKAANNSHVVATLKGTGKARILLMAHMDTVFKEGSAAERPFHIKDGRAYGPGVMDDKGGIVAGIYALKVLKDQGFKDYAQITFLLDASEETGSDAASELIRQTAKAHDVTLNLEPGRGRRPGGVAQRQRHCGGRSQRQSGPRRRRPGTRAQRRDGSGAPDPATGQAGGC